MTATLRQQRLRRDAQLLEANYSGLKLIHEEHDDQFVGALVMGSATGIHTAIQARIVLPEGYPGVEPSAYDAAGRFPVDVDRHIITDGKCCLWLPWETMWDGRRADGILTFVDQLAVFFHKQLVYEATGQWPGKARGHGTDGYKEFLCERLQVQPGLLVAFLPIIAAWQEVDKYGPCPCGSGKKLRWCHGPAIETAFRAVGRLTIQRSVRLWLATNADGEGNRAMESNK